MYRWAWQSNVLQLYSHSNDNRYHSHNIENNSGYVDANGNGSICFGFSTILICTQSLRCKDDEN